MTIRDVQLTETLARLTQFCESEGIRRFSADEIIELLEEGETVDWILDQVLPTPEAEPASEPDARVQLRQLLEKCAAQVAPEPIPESEEDSSPELAADVAIETPATTGGATAAAGQEEGSLSDLQGLALPPGVDASQLQALMDSPQGSLLADFGAYCEERGMDPQAQQDAMGDQMQQLHEEWLQTPRDSLQGKRPSELLEGGRLLPEKVETFRRDEPKVGRNDSCPCGSGKKYKKCCGR